jgi:hypothetical protein
MFDQKELEKKFDLENKAFMDGMLKGVQIGMTLKKEEIAKRMLQDKEAIDKIMQWTGVSWQTLKKTIEFKEIQEDNPY